MPDIHGWPRGRRTALSLALLGLLLLSSGAVPGGTAADDTAELLHVEDWRDGGHQGADLTVDISADGSRLLLMGYAAPDDVRVTDRDLVPVAVLEPGPNPFDVKGAAWSATDGSALVWGRAAGGDRDVILAYEAPTYALNGSYGASDYGGLVQVDAVCSFVMDIILAVAGRDANGTSMVNVLETASMAVIISTEYPLNATVVHIGDDMRDMVCVDSAGGVARFSSRNWALAQRIVDVVASPTSRCIMEGRPWAIGGSDGNVSLFIYGRDKVDVRARVGDGPVRGLTWVSPENSRVVAATPAPAGGSRLGLFSVVGMPDGSENLSAGATLDIAGNVTMLVIDPADSDVILAAFEDGTLSAYRLRAPPPPPPPPPVVLNAAGDVIDLAGLDYLGKWERPLEGEPRLLFDLSRNGTWVLLANWGAPNEVVVVVRDGTGLTELRKLATLDLGQGFGVQGAVWSRNDTWAVVWGRRAASTADEVVLFDAPAFTSKRVIAMNGTDGLLSIDDVECIRRDRYIAIAGFDQQSRPCVQVRRTDNLTVAATIKLTAQVLDIGYDGSDMAILLVNGELHVHSSKDWTPLYNITGVGTEPSCADFVMAPGWLVGDQGGSCAALLGQRRSVAANLTVGTPVWGTVWTRDVLGDLVTYTSAINSTLPTLQAWRLFGDPNTTGTGSPRMLARLNLSSQPIMMQADPLSPGSIVVAFHDGSLRVYRLNATGDRKWQPFDDLDWSENHDGDGDGDGDGDDGTSWGPSPLLVLGGLVAVAALLGVAILLLRRGGKDGDGGSGPDEPSG